MSVNRLFNLVFLFVIVLLLGLPAHVQSAKAVSHVLPCSANAVYHLAARRRGCQ